MYLTVFVSDWFLCLKLQASSCDWKKLEMNMNWNKRSIYQSHSTVLCYEVLIRRSLWTRVWLLPQYLLCEDQMTQRFCIFWLAIKSYFIWLCYVKLIDRIDWNKCTKIWWFWKVSGWFSRYYKSLDNDIGIPVRDIWDINFRIQ